MDTFQQALAEQVAEQHRHHGKALFFYVWGALLVMTAIEVYLTYQSMQPVKMLTILLGLSFIKSRSTDPRFEVTTSSTPFKSSFASLRARCVFAAFTTILVSVPVFARNSCVLLQVIQPLR